MEDYNVLKELVDINILNMEKQNENFNSGR